MIIRHILITTTVVMNYHAMTMLKNLNFARFKTKI